MFKVRIVYKPATIEAKVFENGMEVREYSTYKEAKECIDNYAELSIVDHVHFVNE